MSSLGSLPLPPSRSPVSPSIQGTPQFLQLQSKGHLYHLALVVSGAYAHRSHRAVKKNEERVLNLLPPQGDQSSHEASD